MSEARSLTEPKADEAPDRIAWLREAREKLQSLLHLSRGWDSYEADPPNQSAIHRAEQVLTAVNSTPYRPDRIAPSIEGGVVFSFRRGDRYGDIECDNDGDVVALTPGRTLVIARDGAPVPDENARQRRSSAHGTHGRIIDQGVQRQPW